MSIRSAIIELAIACAKEDARLHDLFIDERAMAVLKGEMGLSSGTSRLYALDPPPPWARDVLEARPTEAVLLALPVGNVLVHEVRRP